MDWKKITALILIVAALAAFAPTRASAGLGERFGYIYESAAEHLRGETAVGILARFSAFTGLVYWLFSDSDFSWSFSADGIEDLLSGLFDFSFGAPNFDNFDKNAQGTYSL